VKRSRDRILTTHAGSLPRPADLLARMQATGAGQPGDRPAYTARVRSAVADVVQKQVEHGLDVIDDGEMGKPSFVTYVVERLAGFERGHGHPTVAWAKLKSLADGARLATKTLWGRA
jgi:5-methyltetrahydropteroyltriglutamate--homocysteine methyltransferase